VSEGQINSITTTASNYHVPIDPASNSSSSVVGMQVCLTSRNIPFSTTAMKRELFDQKT